MSANISNIVKVTITRETKSVSQTGFGTMLILGSNATFTNRVRAYESLDQVKNDFSTTQDEYKAALAAFGQEKKPEIIKIGKRDAAVVQVVKIAFSADFVMGNSITYSINDKVQPAVPFNTDHPTTLANLAKAIQTHPFIGDAKVSAARELTVTAKTAGVPFLLKDVVVIGGASQPKSTLTVTTESYGILDDLTKIEQVDDDWYALVLTSRTQAEIEQAASYIEAHRKIFVTASNDSKILDQTSATDIGSVLNLKNYERTAVFYNATLSDFADAAWLGRCLPENPGAITWKFKTLNGITADNLNPTQRSAALKKNVNLFTEIGGRDITEEGTMASGEFIDVIRDTDWLQARLEEEIYSRLVNLGKVPYTDAGVAIIEATIRAVLRNAQTANVLALDPDFTVTVPKVAEVPFNDRAHRLLPDVRFSATLASAIHKIIVDGVVAL